MAIALISIFFGLRETRREIKEEGKKTRDEIEKIRAMLENRDNYSVDTKKNNLLSPDTTTPQPGHSGTSQAGCFKTDVDLFHML